MRVGGAGLVILLGAMTYAPTVAAKLPNWSIQATPNPTGARSSSLSGVSCPSQQACTAVGSFTNSSGTQTMLAEGWKGSRWSIERLPVPAGATASGLNGVSCTSANACTAVGSFTTSAGTTGLAERWNGVRWVIQNPPGPAGATGSSLNGVSCKSSRFCIAVGHFNGPATGQSLAEKWNGATWVLQSVPPANFIGPASSVLNGVSCASAAACTAAGQFSAGRPAATGGMGGQWNGVVWTIESAANDATVLSGVSCTSASACVAVGTWDYLHPDTGVIKKWNGVTWTNENAPVPPGTVIASDLNGDSCASTDACIAVGWFIAQSAAGTLSHTLVDQWNGSSWAVQNAPTPRGGVSLNSVSCISANRCTAVGAAGGRTLAERYS